MKHYWKKILSGVLIASLLIFVLPKLTLAATSVDTFISNTAGQGNTSMTITITVSGSNSNRALILFVGAGDTTTGAVSSVTGGGATWAHCATGGASNGNGAFHGDCYAGTGPSSGSQVITINFTGITTTNMGAIIYSVYNVDQTTPTSGYTATLSGNNVITTATGDLTLSASIDTNNNRSVTGCTSSTDISTFGSVGVSSAQCTSSSSTTYTWSGFGGTSIVMGVNIKQVSSGGGATQVPSTKVVIDKVKIIQGNIKIIQL